MLKKVYRQKRTKNHVSDEVYASYKQQLQLAVLESDSNVARQLRSAAKRMLRNEKNKAWTDIYILKQNNYNQTVNNFKNLNDLL